MSELTAVVLAGGKGERLAPLSFSLPKALTPVNGQPFLSYLLKQIERCGIKKVVILAGYLGESISNYCASLKTNMNITCHVDAIEDSPAQRIIRNYDSIGHNFILMYCDNFIPDDEIISCLNASKAPLTFTIHKRPRGNIKVYDNGTVHYFAGERLTDYGFVELGYLRVKTDKFFKYLVASKDLPIALMEYSKTNSSNAVEIKSPYWSISDLDRYSNIRQGRRMILLDRDGVLNYKRPKREYVANWKQFRPIEENWSAIQTLANYGIDFLVITNQPGIATGEVEPDFLQALHHRIATDFLSRGVGILAFYVCPHHWNYGCNCRKPMPGMIEKALNEFRISPDETLYIGDDDRDYWAASKAGVRSLLVGKNHTLDFDFDSMSDAIEPILKMLGS